MRCTLPQRRTPLRRTSDLRRSVLSRRGRWGDRRAYRLLRDLVMGRDGWACRRCGESASDCHHVLTRARGGKDEADNLVALCRRCHSWVHANPAEATRRGWLQPSWGAR
ncbi:MAG: HNH endonuclease [Pseudonocardiaceae bacterium]